MTWRAGRGWGLRGTLLAVWDDALARSTLVSVGMEAQGPRGQSGRSVVVPFPVRPHIIYAISNATWHVIPHHISR